MIVMQLANDLPYTGIDIWGALKDCGNVNDRTTLDFDEDCASASFSVISDVINLATDFLVVLVACPNGTMADPRQSRSGLGEFSCVRAQRIA